MAYDTTMAERIRTSLRGEAGIAEIQMFGGLCFTVRGNMACGVTQDAVMVRVGPDQYDKALEHKHARPMDFTGKPLKGMVYVDAAGLRTSRDVKRWVGMGLDYACSLPAKKKSANKKATKKKTEAASSRNSKKQRKPVRPATESFTGFGPATFRFLTGLEKNNNKKWFDAHRAEYEAGYLAPALSFIEALGPELKKISKSIYYAPKVNGSLFRINRDVRFGKDKTPYKAHLDLWFWEGEKRGWDAPGFFFRLTPKRLILGTGMHRFDKPKLERFRDLVADARTGKSLERSITKVTGAGPYKLGKATRKTVPRGFDPDQTRAGLLKHEGVVVTLEQRVPKEAKNATFVRWCSGHYRKMAPLHLWLLKNLC